MNKSASTLSRCLMASIGFGVFSLSHSQTLWMSESDGTFASPTPWTFTAVVTTSQTTVTATNFTTGGDPGAFERNIISFALMPKLYASSGALFAVNSSATWTPSLMTHPFSQLVWAADESTPAPALQGLYLLIVQDGLYYFGAPTKPALANEWQATSYTALSETDFSEIDHTSLAVSATSHPDFTSANPITFGYLLYGQHTITGASDPGTVDIDNWSISVYEDSSAPISVRDQLRRGLGEYARQSATPRSRTTTGIVGKQQLLFSSK